MRLTWTLLLVLLLDVIVQTYAQARRNVAAQCQVVPSPGRCQQNQSRRFWSYSAKIGSCTQLFGCYGIRDRNVFLTRRGCERNCYISGGIRPPPSPMECDLNPSPGMCQDSQKRTFWSYSSKTSGCMQITGCYTLSDRNVFLTRMACRRNCVLNRPETKPLPAIIPGIPKPLPAIIPNNNVSTLPVDVAYKVNVECRVNPSAGACRQNEKRNYYTYSSKSGSCVNIFGCYSIRDRNVFMTRDGCRNECLIRDGTGGEWARDAQCYINPSPGRCDMNQRKTHWTYSSKLDSCTQIFGCYSVRDRNVFITEDGCKNHCVGNNSSIINPPDLNIKIALECRINPSAGVCTDREKRSFYSYSSKTGDCIQIFGCYSVRDRNVFLTRANCRRGCFLSDGGTTVGTMEAQCYIHPSQGRCTENEKRTYYTYSTKTSTCVEIYGCYGIRDRNVFLTRSGCRQACTGSTLGPVTLPTINPGTGVTLPAGTDYKIAPECRINPSPDVCQKNQEREYFMFSSKSNTCVRIFGCYSVYDRNVFLTRDGCRRNCYVYDGVTPSGAVDAQCYLNPSPGRCRDSEKRSYFSYSSKTMSCSTLYGCYSIRDRNVFLTRNACENACTPTPISTPPPIPISKIAAQCRINPSAGRCPESDRRTYYSYSTKTHMCTEIYGCYSIRDRNVFLTRAGCRQNCFLDKQPSGGKEAQCFINPSPGNCPGNRRRTFYTYSQKTSTCVRIYGCYSVRDRNVFLTRAGCRRRCDSVTTRPRNPAETTTRSQFEISFVDIRGVRNGGVKNPNMVDIRNMANRGSNMVDIRQGGTNNFDVTNMIDIRDSGAGIQNNKMTDIRRDAGGIVPGSGMVDIRRGKAPTGVKMVDIRTANTGPQGSNMIDIRNDQGSQMIDIRNGLSGPNMVDIRGGQGLTRVDIRKDTTGNGMVDIRGNQGGSGMTDIRRDAAGNMVDIRQSNTGHGGGMVDIRGGSGSQNLIDIRGGSTTGGGANLVDIRGGNNRGSFVDIRQGSSASGGNMVDIRRDRAGSQNGFVDIRSGNAASGGNMVDIRRDGSASQGNVVDIRQTQRPSLVDIRQTGRRGNMVDLRGSTSRTSNMVDIRNRNAGSGSTFVDIRKQTRPFIDIRGSSSSGPNMVDIRSGGSNMVDIRSGGSNMVDIRGDPTATGNMVDIRGGSTGNMVDIRSGSGGMVDIRGGSSGNPNMVDIRGGSVKGNKMVDIRGGSASNGMVDIRGGSIKTTKRVDIRGGSSGNPNMVDIRGGSVKSNKMVDIRGGQGGAGNLVDIRGGAGVGMVDIRGNGGTLVDIRGTGGNGNMVDIRGGSNTGNMIDIRGGSSGSSGMVDIRGGSSGSPRMVDIRGGSSGSPGMVDIRGGSSGSSGMVDIRGGSSGSPGMVDIRGGSTGGSGMVDIRGGSSGNMVDIRGGSNMVDIRGGSNMVDIRGGSGNTGGMVDIRGGPSNTGNMVDIRGGSTGAGMVDIRGGGSTGAGMVDIRGGSTGAGMVDIRGGSTGPGMVDIRGGSTGAGMVDIRGGSASSGKLVDIRGGSSGSGGMVDIRGGSTSSGKMVDIRGGSTGSGGMVDIRGGTSGSGNMVDIRGGASGSGNMVDIRGGSSGSSGMVDIRGGTGNMVDIRGGSGNMVDIRSGATGSGGMVDIRGGSTGNMVDIRGGSTGNMVDIRGGSGGSGNMVDIRGRTGGTGFVDIRNGANMVDIRGQGSGGMVDIRNQGSGGMVDIRNQGSGGMVDIRNQGSGGMVDIRNQGSGGMVDIRNEGSGGMVDIRGGQTQNMVDIRNRGGSGMVDIRGETSANRMVDIRTIQGTVDGSITVYDPSREITSLTDLPIINIEPGIRIARECLINPTPGICLENQRKTFWTFSTKTNSCTRITGCFDIHDRNTWLTLNGCRNNCFKNDSKEEPIGVLPLECQLNPTPGRCVPSEERTVWVYNTKLAACTELTGCYDFHDRNVWSSRARCRTKCRLESAIVAPEIPYDVKGITIAQECHINPSPGRCLESRQKTFWTFSSKTSACTRITGCYNIRDRNTWLTRASCQGGCIINETNVIIAKPLECKLIPSPGRCLESQKRSVWTYSEKLGICVEVTGCYDFHDRNVWLTEQFCNVRCQVNITGIPDLKDYDIALECQLNPSPGRCTESEKRTFYSFSNKVGGCVEIYGCYTINDRNVWYTRDGCRRSCLIPKPGTDVTPDFVAPGCLRPPLDYACLPNQRTSWFMYDVTSGGCVPREGCYRLGDRNVFVNKRRCEVNCFGRLPDNAIGGIARECKLNPTPGVCREDERQTYWSYSQKTGTCVQLTGCYTIRDRNVWLTRQMCRNNCIKKEYEQRSSVLPNFLADATQPARQENGNRWGRRGRILTRNSNRDPVTTGNHGSDIIVSDIFTTVDIQTGSGPGSPPRVALPLRNNQAGTVNPNPSSRVMEALFSSA